MTLYNVGHAMRAAQLRYRNIPALTLTSTELSAYNNYAHLNVEPFLTATPE